MSARKPGVTIASVCAQSNISLGQFLRWYKLFDQLASGMIKRRLMEAAGVLNQWEIHRCPVCQSIIRQRIAA